MKSSSSRESSPAYSITSTEEQHSEPDSSHLAALEKLLQASLGSQLPRYTADIAPEPLETISPTSTIDEELSVPPEPPVVEEQPLEDEVVAFRLFSTQKIPQKIVIREFEIWPTVADPRIRDVGDESSEIVEERERRIQSIAISGDLVQLQSQLVFSARSSNVTTMTTTSPTTLPPSLARISGIIPPAAKTTRSRGERRNLAQRKPRQYPRYPIPSFPQSIALHALLEEEVPLTPQAAAEKKKREKKDLVARIQFEQDERGRKNREEKARRRVELEMEAQARAEAGGDAAKKKKKRKADAMTEGDVSMAQSGVVETPVSGGGKGTKRGAAAKARRTAQRLAARQEQGEEISSIAA